MSNKNSGYGKTVPEAKEALKKFRNEVAGSMNITLNEGYNGDISARDAGKIGGEMVKRMVNYAADNMPEK